MKTLYMCIIWYIHYQFYKLNFSMFFFFKTNQIKDKPLIKLVTQDDRTEVYLQCLLACSLEDLKIHGLEFPIQIAVLLLVCWDIASLFKMILLHFEISHQNLNFNIKKQTKLFKSNIHICIFYLVLWHLKFLNCLILIQISSCFF